MSKNIYHSMSVLAILITMSACGAQYAKVKIEDARPNDEYVYGDINGPARQLKNSYGPTTAESAQIASDFRKKIEASLVSAK